MHRAVCIVQFNRSKFYAYSRYAKDSDGPNAYKKQGFFGRKLQRNPSEGLRMINVDKIRNILIALGVPEKQELLKILHQALNVYMWATPQKKTW